MQTTDKDGFTSVSSGHLDAVKYDSMARQMTVRFQNGYHYAVHDVSPEDYDAFMASNSQGEHYHRVLKSQFQIERIK